MVWEFWISTGIAIIALLVSISAKRDAKGAADRSHELQERLELYDHFPIIRLRLELDDKKVFVVISNISDKIAAADYEIDISLQVWTASSLSLDRSDFNLSGNDLLPNKTERRQSPLLNDVIGLSLPLLDTYPGAESRFQLRAVAKCSPPHPKAKKVIEYTVAALLYKEGQLSMAKQESSL